MIRQFESKEKLQMSSRQAHRELLASFWKDLSRVASEDVCMCCIRRTPQNPMKCIHTICPICTRMFYEKDGLNLRRITKCIICGIGMNDVTSDPHDIAGIRLLGLDGCSVRGIGEIETLMKLEKYVDLPYPIIRNFDICCATSCGMDYWSFRFTHTANCIRKRNINEALRRLRSANL